MNNKTQILELFILMIFILSSCKSEIGHHIPQKHVDISQGKYDKYLSQLNEAYRSNDNFEAAIQLANLKANKQITYQTLNSTIKANNENLHYNCEKIYDWFWMYDRHNFGVNIVKYDTILFKNAIKLCNTLTTNNSYELYAAMRDQQEIDTEANKEKEDTTNFNHSLVKQLKQIHIDDQSIRIKLSKKSISLEMKNKLYKEMNIVDSLNMIKIDRIFNDFGYPSIKLVGKECNFTPALVIHHSKYLKTRYKYLPFLEKAVKEGLLYEGSLNMIKRRIEDMELDKKK